jgi:hypothetical protein
LESLQKPDIGFKVILCHNVYKDSNGFGKIVADVQYFQQIYLMPDFAEATYTFVAQTTKHKDIFKNRERYTSLH